MNKSQDVINLHVQSCIYETLAFHVAIVSCLLVSFLVAMQIVSQGYFMRDDLVIDSSLSAVVRKIKEIQQICQKEHRSGLLKHIRHQLRYISKRTIVFRAERQRTFWNVLHFFAVSAMQNSVPLHIRFTTFKCLAYRCARIGQGFSLICSHLRRRFYGVILSHAARVEAGCFAVLVYLAFLNRIW